MQERIEQRCLGALEFVDAITGSRVREPLTLRSERLRLRANASALYVIRWAQGLEAHLDAFETMPDTPAFAADDGYLVDVIDPQQRYLARRARIALPRKAAPQDDPDSVLRPVQVPLYPAGARPVEASWAVLRASVFTMAGPRRVGLANAWLTLAPTLAGVAPVSALTDAHGEALLAVTGVAPVRPVPGVDEQDPDAVFTRRFAATLRVVLHAGMVHREDARTPRPLADPSQIERDIVDRPAEVRILTPPVAALAPGELQRVTVEVAP